MSFEKVNVEELQLNPFKMIGKEWMLITAQKEDGSVNTMTASWGNMGVFWGKNVVTVGLRPQRYTKEFVDANEIFTLTFFDEKYKNTLSYFGTVSGRDEDKITKSGFQVVGVEENAPSFAEGKLVLVCKKLMETSLDPKDFSEEIDKNFYPNKDYHRMYMAEVIAAYQKA